MTDTQSISVSERTLALTTAVPEAQTMGNITATAYPDSGPSGASLKPAAATSPAYTDDPYQASPPKKAAPVLSCPMTSFSAITQSPSSGLHSSTASMTSPARINHNDTLSKRAVHSDPGRDRGRAESSLQGELSGTAITTHTCSTANGSAFTGLKGVSLASFTLPKPDEEQQKHVAENKPSPVLNPDQTDFQPDPLRQGASAETACTSYRCSTANTPTVEHPASFTSPEVGPAQNQSTTSCKRSTHGAAPSTQRPRAGRTFVIPVSRGTRRGRHFTRTPHPLFGRTGTQIGPKTQVSHRAQKNPQAPPVALPTQAPWAGTSAIQVAAWKPAGQAETLASPVGAQGNTSVLPVATPVIDMDGVSHVLGGLVEKSVGCHDWLLFAKQIRQEDPSLPYNAFRVERHDFWRFPPPDMREANREFDRELEECRVIHKGFDQDLIETLIDKDAEGAMSFANAMEQYQQERDPLYESVSSMKEKLAQLACDRECTEPPVLKQRKNNKLLCKIAEDEAAVMRDLENAEAELEEVLLRGRRKIACALRRGFNPAGAIQDIQAEALRRHTAKQESEELGTAAAMIGLCGGRGEQDHETGRASTQYSQHVVDEALEALDQPAKRDEPIRPSLERKLDSVVTAVPEWFAILDAKETVELYGATSLDRYKELIQVFAQLATSKESEQSAADKSVGKQYHGPDPAWPNEKQRRSGGWWTCRSGPDVSSAERNCRMCHPRATATLRRRASARVTTQTVGAPSVQEAYEHMLGEIEKAMVEANKRDQLALKHQLQQEQRDLDRYWQQREWHRSGHGFDVGEVLYDRGVNELNYRPSAGPSRSRQSGGSAAAQPQEVLAGKRADDRSPDQNASPKAFRREGSLPMGHDLLLGRQTDLDSPEPARPSDPPRRHSSLQPHELHHGSENSGESSGTPAGPPQHRSSLLRPGQKCKRKSVSWML